MVSTRTSANDSTTHESTLHDGFFVGDFWCAKEDTITRARAREGLSMCPLLTPPKESSIPCSLRNNSSRRDRKYGHVMMRLSIYFWGKLVGVSEGVLCTPNMYKRERRTMVFGRETTRNTRLHRLDDTDEPPLLFCSMRPKRSRLFSSFRSLLLLLLLLCSS